MGRRIGGAGGGSDKAGGGLVLGAVVLALALGFGGAAGTAGGSGSVGSAGRGAQARADSRSSDAAAARLTARGLRIDA